MWNYKSNGSALMAFDSTVMIVKFNNEINRDHIIAFLQNNNIELMDSLFDHRITKINNTLNKPTPKILEKKFEFTVSPNPSNEYLHLFIKATSIADVYTMEMINMLRQKVIQPSRIVPNAKFKLDVSTVPTGVYFVKIINKNGEHSVKRISILR